MIPGRILIVDDKKGEVDELIDEFLRRGEHAIFSETLIESEYCNNVRLLIMDYYLFEDSEENSLSAMANIVNEISKKSKFFMVVIWSAKVTEANRRTFEENIKKKYFAIFKADMPGILVKPIGRRELDYVSLIHKIEEEIRNHPDLNLIYEIEKIVNNAKDSVLNEVYDIGNWSNLVKNLKKEYDIDSISRQIMFIYANIMKRNITPTEELTGCIRRLMDLRETFTIDDFGKIYSTQYYYVPTAKEQIGTGDILHYKNTATYYMVITPECDITNDKHTATKLIESTRVDHSKLDDPHYIDEVAEFLDIKNQDGSINRNKIIDAIIHGGKKNYYNLLFLRDENSDFYHLIFDFHQIKSLKKVRRISELQNYKRVCRVDSPLINEFIQQYAAHCSRFGSMSIPKKISKILKSNLRQSMASTSNRP